MAADAFTMQLSAMRFLYYTHYAHILETGGIAKAMTIDDFVPAMGQGYIENPQLDHELRENILRQQLNRLDGLRRRADRGFVMGPGRRPRQMQVAGTPVARALYRHPAECWQQDSNMYRLFLQ